MWVIVVLAYCIHKCMSGLCDRHCGKVWVLKTILVFLTIIELSLIAAGIEGGGAMIAALATNIVAYLAVEAVRKQSKYPHFSTIRKFKYPLVFSIKQFEPAL
jgi:hypothetical protein